VRAPGAARPDALHATVLALALSLGAAVSLGITRFACGLLLPAMREDLGWSYALAGAMNTANALGYLIGALATPALLRRLGPAGAAGRAALASLFMACSGFFTEAAPLLVQRLLAGAASALVFIAGGLLAARLGPCSPGARAGCWACITAAPAGASRCRPAWCPGPAAGPGPAHGWRWAWWALAGLCLLASLGLLWPARRLAALLPPASVGAPGRGFDPRPLWPALAGYAAGVGYIGYMTFVVALLREQAWRRRASRCSMRCSGWRCCCRPGSGPACWSAPAARRAGCSMPCWAWRPCCRR
jgi:MFS family permease